MNHAMGEAIDRLVDCGHEDKALELARRHHDDRAWIAWDAGDCDAKPEQMSSCGSARDAALELLMSLDQHERPGRVAVARRYYVGSVFLDDLEDVDTITFWEAENWED